MEDVRRIDGLPYLASGSSSLIIIPFVDVVSLLKLFFFLQSSYRARDLPLVADRKLSSSWTRTYSLFPLLHLRSLLLCLQYTPNKKKEYLWLVWCSPDMQNIWRYLFLSALIFLTSKYFCFSLILRYYNLKNTKIFFFWASRKCTSRMAPCPGDTKA